jgi:hypothetical protein
MNLPTSKDFSKLSNADLRTKLARALEATVAGIYEAAAIWSELNRRGETLPRLSGIMQFLPRIARGELAAETVIAFAGQISLIGCMVGMPLDEQRKYADGECVSVATFDDGGKPVAEAKPLSDLTAREVRLVIDRGEVRPLKAQINSLKHSRTQTATKPPYSRVTIRADIGGGVLVVGLARIAPSELAAALRSLGWRLERIDRAGASADEGARPHA